jgi:YVTN family beta-propeller protein
MRPWLALICALGVLLAGAGGVDARSVTPPVPLVFEANVGQADSEVRFLARGRGTAAFLTPTAIVLPLAGDEGSRPAALRIGFAGARPATTLTGLDELEGKAHYFTGNDPARWRRDVPTFARVRARQLYGGVDVVYYATPSSLEFDFVVAPGADPRVIALTVDGAEALEIASDGALDVRVRGRSVRLQKPVVYQDGEGGRREIAGRYRLDGPRRVRFQLAAYDRARPLVIDPVLTYSSFHGGSGLEYGFGLAVDGQGFVYLTGVTSSANFPLQNPLQPARNGLLDVFVTKLTRTGALVYSTYLGGSNQQQGYGIAADRAGHAYVTGSTSSVDFPVLNALQGTLNGTTDAFVARLDAAGGLVYSTYLGGKDSDSARAIAVDGRGFAIVTGTTFSPDFPVVGAVQPLFGGKRDAFVAKLDPKGGVLVYSTYLGGSDDDEGRDITVLDGSAYVVGQTRSWDFPLSHPLQGTPGGGFDAFVAKLDPSGANLVFSTFLGGSGADYGLGIALDAEANIYVVGETASVDFPIANALQGTRQGPTDAFVTKLDRSASTLVYSTYLGGSWNDSAWGVAVDRRGRAHVVGRTDSTNFPTANAVQAVHAGGVADAFVARLNAAGSTLTYSTYLGGADDEEGLRIALDAERNAWVTGSTYSANFPTKNALQPARAGTVDAFVTRITDTFAYVTSYSGQSFTSLDVATNTPAPPASLVVGPRGVALAADGALALVADSSLNRLLFVNTATGAVTGTVIVGTMPLAVAPSLDGTLAFVTNLISNSVSIVDVASRTVLQTFPVGTWPIGVAVAPDGTVYVANAGDNTVSVLRVWRFFWWLWVTEIARVPVGATPYGVAASPHGFVVYVTNVGGNSVSAIDTSTLAEVARVPVGTAPRGVAMSPVGARAYVTSSGSNEVSVLDTITSTVVATIPVGAWPEGVAVSPGGTRVYVTNFSAGSVSIIDTATNAVVATPVVPAGPWGVATTP